MHDAYPASPHSEGREWYPQTDTAVQWYVTGSCTESQMGHVHLWSSIRVPVYNTDIQCTRHTYVRTLLLHMYTKGWPCSLTCMRDPHQNSQCMSLHWNSSLMCILLQCKHTLTSSLLTLTMGMYMNYYNTQACYWTTNETYLGCMLDHHM